MLFLARLEVNGCRRAITGFPESPLSSKTVFAIPSANLSGALAEQHVDKALAAARQAIALQRIEGNAWNAFDHHAVRVTLAAMMPTWLVW